MRYANGVTFWTARSILSATLVKAVIAGSARNYRTHERTAMSAPWRRHASCRGDCRVAFLNGLRAGRLHSASASIALAKLHVSVFTPDKNGLSISWPSLIATLKKRNHLAETSRALIGAASS